MSETYTDDFELKRLAAILGRSVIIEDFGVYLESRSGADDERLGRTISDAKRVLLRRVQKRQAASADQFGLPN